MTLLTVGISGGVAAGKTTAARALEEFGFGSTRISKVIDNVLRERGEVPSRERHQAVGWELHQQKGQAWLCEQAVKIILPRTDIFVVDGLRWDEDVAYFRDSYGARFLHIHISAPESLRKNRFEQDDKGIGFEEVISHPVEQAVEGLADNSDLLIVNDAGEEAFKLQVVGRVLERQLNAS